MSILAAAALALPLATGLAATPPPVTISATPSVIALGRPGAVQRTAITVGVDRAARLIVTATSANGQRRYTILDTTTVGPTTLHASWPATAGTVAQGLFHVVATEKVGADAVGTARTDVLLDSRAPTVGRPRPLRAVLSGGRLSLRVALSDVDPRLTVRMRIVGQYGGVTLSRPVIRSSGAGVALLYTGVLGLRPGGYSVQVVARDRAGWVGRSPQVPILVAHPVRAIPVRWFRNVGRRVVLAFDDCLDGQAWGSMLRTLRVHHAHATFFCNGTNLSRAVTVARRTVADGNAIGSHGYQHLIFPTLTQSRQTSLILQDRDLWWAFGRVSPTPFFRAPYGSYNASTLAAAGAAGCRWLVGWNVDPRDWSRPGSAAIAARVLSAIGPGSITVMHVLPQTAAALPTILDGLAARGLKPVTIAQMVAVPGAVPRN